MFLRAQRPPGATASRLPGVGLGLRTAHMAEVSGSAQDLNKCVHAIDHEGWRSVFESLRARQNNNVAHVLSWVALGRA